MTITPLDDRVVIKRIAQAEQKVGNIYIPETAKEKPQIGEVLAVGQDEDLRELVSVGDRVIFGKYSGTEFELDGNEVIILQRMDLLGKVVE